MPILTMPETTGGKMPPGRVAEAPSKVGLGPPVSLRIFERASEDGGMADALVPLLCSYLVTFLLARKRLQGGASSFAQLDAHLDALEESVLSGSAPPKTPTCALSDIFVTEIRSGRPVVDALHALRAQLESARTHELETQRLARALLMRSVLVSVLSLGTRLVLTSLAVRPVDVALDRLAGLLAGATFCAAALVLLRSLPRSWAWHSGPSPQVLAWLKARVGRSSAAGLACAELLRALTARELRQGISLRSARLRLLDRHAARLGARDRERLRQLEDLVPILELMGLGLPGALLLLAPLRASI